MHRRLRAIDGLACIIILICLSTGCDAGAGLDISPAVDTLVGDSSADSSTNVLTSLFVRGRHLGFACWLLTEKLRIVSLFCRTNFCWMLVWRLRNAKERDQIFEELPALLPPKTLLQMYNMATSEKHSFGYINLLSERDELFYKNFGKRMLVQE